MKNLSDINDIWNFVEEFLLIEAPNIFIDESNIKEELFIHFLSLTKEIGNKIYSKKITAFDKNISFENKLKKYILFLQNNKKLKK